MKYQREKNFESTKYSHEKNSNPQNTDEKKLRTHEIPTRMNFGPTKARWHQIHKTHDGT